MPSWRSLNEPISIGDREYPPITEGKANKLLDEYYDERGWNIKDGTLTRKKLDELGLSNVAENLGI